MKDVMYVYKNTNYEIRELIGYDSFVKGLYYPDSYISIGYVEKVDDGFIQNFSVKSETFNRSYSVTIENNGEKIKKFSCNCPRFKEAHTCKHVGAVLTGYYDEIISHEIIDEMAVSKSILSLFSTPKNIIKEELNIDITLEFKYNSIVLVVFVGTSSSKQYKLSTVGKLYSFIASYLHEDLHEFGKTLTYDPNKHYLNDKNRKILDFLAEVFYYDNRNSNGYDLKLSYNEFKRFLDVLKEKEFEFIGMGKVYNIYDGMPTNFVLKKEEDDFVLDVEDYNNYKVIATDIVYYNHSIYLLDNNLAKYFSLMFDGKLSNLKFRKEDINLFNEGLFNKIKNNITISEDISEISIPTIPDVKLYFDIAYLKLKCDVVFCYGDKSINYFEKTDILRDTEEEQKVITELLENGFTIDNNELIMIDEEMIYYFLDEKLTELSEKYEVFTSKKIDETKILKKVSVTNNFSIGKDGIMSYSFSTDGISNEELSSVFTALKQKKKYFRLKNNNVVDLSNNDELENLNNLMNDLNLSNDDISNGTSEIPKYRALYIDSLKNNKYKNIKTNNLFDEFIENFKKYKDVNLTLSNEDESILRDYQKDGVKWLKTIYKCDLGGILADEMGLGKSIQTIMFIKEILKENENAKIIIVVPTSLIYNWQKEFEKFASNLKFVVVADNKIKRLDTFKNKDKYNIFITSYGLIRNDKDEYENMDFELCVVDEAQNIKNYQAQMTKEIKKIKAKCKIALTGTPLENNLMELWSIFDYIMPGYLNSVLKFREKYNIKDVDKENLKILKSLNYQITPFILRRKKQDVIESLPEKQINKVYIDLPDKQKMLYMKVLHDTKEEIDEMTRNGGFQKSRMKILQLLTKLRQICIDPNVMYDNYDGESIKIEELLRIVNECIENNHKILIFSSFKRVLDNVKVLFNKNNISYYMIDGSVKSKDRMDMVDSFNQDDTNCFLITLKAGGTGLNLVGADTVIHLDIWWNPQVENQATDRAHRIGQTKKVSVIKLITRGTIEERIIELQEKKQILSDELLDGKDSTEALSSLTEKDIKKLLSVSDE